MKKFALICLSALSLAAVSCNVNELPGFDESDAFVAFAKSSYTIAENGGTLSIPVHASSISAPAAAISVKVNDGSAKQGVDFKLADATGVINIPAGSYDATLNVEIIPNPGVFTGDKTFTIELVSAEGFTMGKENTVKVTIADTDHPLSAILGAYNCSIAADYYGDSYEYSITVEKDSEDVSVVWITGLDPYWAMYGYKASIYGNVDEDMTKITIPMDQAAGYGEYAYYGADDEWNDVPIVLSISTEGDNVVLTNDTIVYTSNGTYSGAIILPGEKWIKK